MLVYGSCRRSLHQFRIVLSSFLHKEGLPFSQVLSEKQINAAFEAEGACFAESEEHIFTPAVVLWAFLSQVLHKEEHRSCLAAVCRVIVLLVHLGRKPCAKSNGPYCRARAKLPEAVIERLTLEVAQGCERQVPRRWLWRGRHVKLVDGTTVSMPDTPQNQAVYPQHPGQQRGLGFPIARVVVLLSLATAMLCGMAMGPYAGKETGEMALFRQLLPRLQKGDIVLADRYYCCYFMIAMLMQLGVDIVARIHQLRKTDFCRGQRLGKHDRLVRWQRPRKPDWMDQETYDQMPEWIELRQVLVQVNQRGFRTESFIVVTTLTDAMKYPKEELAQLYHKRWLVELDIRAIKGTLGMDELRCKTPQMVRKEVWTCLLAYNLIRKAMLEAAAQSNLSPRKLSFTAAMQTVVASWGTLPIGDERMICILIEVELRSLTAQLIGNRPNRVEPRAVKRRPNPLRLLTKPRDEARAELLAGIRE
jgi:hypothetical protein